MNCTNCGRPMNTAHACIHCDNEVSYQTGAAPMYLPPHNHNDMNPASVWYDRHTVALESIERSLRNLPSKRELLVAMVRLRNLVVADLEDAVHYADAIIAACKESEPMKGDAT